LIRKIVKMFVHRIFPKAAGTRPVEQRDKVMLFELAHSLRTYKHKAARFDDREVALMVAAGLEDQELEKDVRRWAPGLPEIAPTMFPQLPG